ncbi:MAG: hypothetical protein FJW39_09120 [Acidobacteria bacterium]|nr:hypothetical protein [Acidobacteriota bacterium]
MTESGMLSVLLDSNGTLLRLESVPPQVSAGAAKTDPPDWGQLLHAAGIDAGKVKPVDPQWMPPSGWDQRAGWDGRSTSR